MAANKKAMKKVGRAVMLMALFALLFFIIVMTVTSIIDAKYGEGQSAIQPVPKDPTPVPEAPQVVAADLVFVTEDDGTLHSVFIAETDCVNVMWRMSVIPSDTRLELSTALYAECIKVNISTPQLLTVSELFKCLKGDTAVKLTAKAIRELLPFSPDHVVTMKKTTYLKLFRENPEEYSYGDFLNPEIMTRIKEAGGLLSFVKEIAGECGGYLSPPDALFYLETYESLTNLRVSCRITPGERHNNGYRIYAVSADFYKK